MEPPIIPATSLAGFTQPASQVSRSENLQKTKKIIHQILLSFLNTTKPEDLKGRFTGIDLSDNSNGNAKLVLTECLKRIELFANKTLFKNLSDSLEKLSIEEAIAIKQLINTELQEPSDILTDLNNGVITVIVSTKDATLSRIIAQIINKIKAISPKKDVHGTMTFPHFCYEDILGKKHDRSPKVVALPTFHKEPTFVEISLLIAYEIRIFVPGILYIDTMDSVFQRKNITIAAHTIDMKGKTLELNTSGANGSNLYSTPAPDQADGGMGEDAEAGRDIVIICNQIINGSLKLVSIGGVGGKGQKGGKGDPQEAKREGRAEGTQFQVAWNDPKSYWDGKWFVALGQKGQTGFPGNPGKKGGKCGQSGNGGNINLIVSSGIKNIETLSKPGAPGTPGEGGVGGDGGVGGMGGLHVIKDTTGSPRERDAKLIREGDSDFNWYFNHPYRTNLKTLMGNKPRADQGDPGRAGDVGPVLPLPTELAKNIIPVNVDQVMSDYILYVIDHPQLTLSEKREFIQSILEARKDLTSDTLFVLLSTLEQAELFEGQYTRESIVKWLGAYSAIQNYVSIFKFSIQTENPSTAEAVWSFINLVLLEKIEYLEGVGTGSNRLGFGQVVDLLAFSNYINDYIDNLNKMQADDIKKQTASAYSKRIDYNIESGKAQIQLLQNAVDDYIDQTTQDVKLVLNQLLEMKQAAKEESDEYKAMKKKLEDQMALNMALNILSLGLGMVGAVSGAGALFSQLGNAAIGLQQGQREIRITDKQAIQQRDLSRELYRLETIQTIMSTAPKSGTKNYWEGYDALRDRNYSRFLSSTYKDELEIGRQRMLLEETRARNTQETNKLREEYLNRQQQLLNRQNVQQMLIAGTQIPGMLVGGIANIVINAQREKTQIEALNKAIKDSEAKIESITKSYQNLQKFDEVVLQKQLKPNLQKMQEGFKDSNQFYLAVQGLSMRKFLGDLRTTLEKSLASLESSEKLLTTFRDIQEALQVQIDIYDKIERQRDFGALGNLVAGMTSSISNRSDQENRYRELITLFYLRNLYMAELKAFNAWMFPFGMSTMNMSIYDGLSITSDSSSDLIEKIRNAHAYMKKRIETTQFGTRAMDECFQTGNFCKKMSGPYASLSYQLYHNEIDALQLGEEVEFDLSNMSKLQAVKFVTLYAYLPQLSEDTKLNEEVCSKLEVQIKLRGSASFLLNGSTYAFAQEPTELIHRLDVSVPKDASHNQDGFSAEGENGVLKIYKEKNLNTGRSPYTTIKIKLVRKIEGKIGTFINKEDLQKCAPDVEWWKFEEQLILKKWMIREKEDVFKIARSAMEINSSMDLEGFSPAQNEAIKGTFLNCLKLFPIPNKETFTLEFVGYGKYLNESRWNEESTNLNLLQSEYIQ